MRNILIKREMALGDVIWTIPLVEHFKRSEECHITIMTKHHQAYINNPFIDNVVNYDYHIQNEEVINLDGSYESHRDMHLLEAYYTANIKSPFIFKPSLYPYKVDYERILPKILRLSKFEQIVTIHCAATSQFRIWSRENWENVIKELSKQKIGIILIGANKDYSFEESDNLVNLVGQTEFLEIAALMSFSDLFIGGDSGMSHVAFSMNTPSIVLYNLVSPEFRMSYSSLCYPIVPTNASCQFCMNNINGIYRCDHPEHTECMDAISAKEVISKAKSILKIFPTNQFKNKLKLF